MEKFIFCAVFPVIEELILKKDANSNYYKLQIVGYLPGIKG